MTVSIATTHKEALVVGMRSMPGNPYDGHTLAETLEQVGILTGTDCKPNTAMVDRGYRGVQIEGVRILMSGQKRGITRSLEAVIHRRSAIEPAIEHMKMDGRLARNPLKGALGDALHTVMCGAGHNLRRILATLRLLCAPDHALTQCRFLSDQGPGKNQGSAAQVSERFAPGQRQG